MSTMHVLRHGKGVDVGVDPAVDKSERARCCVVFVHALQAGFDRPQAGFDRRQAGFDRRVARKGARVKPDSWFNLGRSPS